MPTGRGGRWSWEEAAYAGRWGGAGIRYKGHGHTGQEISVKGTRYPPHTRGMTVVPMTVSVCRPTRPTAPSRTTEPCRLVIVDESHKHAGHAAMHSAPGKAGGSGETHFIIEAVSAEFEGLTLIKRHRLVYQASRQPTEGGGMGVLN